MIKLISIEVRKNISYPTFWIILGLHYFLLIIVLSNITDFASSINFSKKEYGNIDLSLIPVFQFPDIWHNIAFIAGFFKILLGILIVISITNEYQYNTVRLNITNGLTRIEFLLSKFLTLFLIAIFSSLVLFISGLVIGLAKSDTDILGSLFSKSEFILAYFLELVLYMSYALFVGNWLKKSGMAIVIMLIYPLIIEPLIRWRFPDNIDRFFPIKIMDNLIAFPFPKYVGIPVIEHVDPLTVGVAIGWIVLFFIFSVLMLKKRNL